MSRVLEPELTWTGAAVRARVQIAVGGDGRIEAVGRARPGRCRTADAASPCSPASSTPIRTPFSGASADRARAFPRARAASGPGGRRCTSWSSRSTARRFAASRRAHSRRCATPASPPSASSTTSTTSARAISRSTTPFSRRRPTPASGWCCCTASTPPARRAARSRAGNAGSPRRRLTSSGARWTGSATRLDPVDPDPGRGAPQHPGREPRARSGASTGRPSRRGLPVHLHVEEQRREIEESLAAYGRHADGRHPRRGRGRRLHRGALHPYRRRRTWRASSPRAARCVSARSPRATWATASRGSARRTRPVAGSRSAPTATTGSSMLEEMRWLEYGQRLRGELRGGAARRGGGGGADPARRGDQRAAPARWAARPGGSRRAAGPTSSRSTSRAPALAEVPTERLLAAIVFGAGNEVIAGTYVGGTVARERGRA